MTSIPPKLRAILAALVAVAGMLVAGGVAITTVDGGRTVTLSKTITLPAAAPAPSGIPGEFVRGSPSSSDAPGVAPAVEAKTGAANDQLGAGTYDTSRVLEGAAAQPAHKTCLTPMHGQARALSQIKLGVVHVTVSSNAPGTRDGDSLCTFFRNVKASPTWTVDNEGNSWLNVPLGFTPWTQRYFNPWSCSIEFVGSTGRPGEGAAQWTDTQLREGARLMAQCFKLAGIIVQRGAIAGTKILKAGIVTHEELGCPAGGCHTDPGPYFNMTRFVELVRQAAGSITSVDRATCRKLNAWRSAGRPKGGAWELRAVARKRALEGRHVRCLPGGPVRA